MKRAAQLNELAISFLFFSLGNSDLNNWMNRLASIFD